MRVAWIMSAFNSESSIAAAVQSIQAQTVTDWQMVVVDDGSTDRTGEIVADLASRDPRLTVIQQPRNRGLAASLNRAWQHTSADVYARLDADDRCEPERLAVQLKFLEAHPHVGVLGSAARLINDHNRLLGILQRPKSHQEIIAGLLRENPFIHPTVVIRREVLQATGGYDQRLRRAQDYELWVRASHHCQFHNLPQPLIRYRLRDVPSWSSIYWGTRMLMRAAWRERRWSTAYRHALRFLVAATLARLHLRESFRESSCY